MPCEPVTSGVPPTRPSSSSSTSSVAFRMKRVDSGGGGGGGARRALTALGTNDTKHNLRLAKSLLTISQDKFAKKWNFDPVMEVPLAQGRFSWTPTISSSSPAVGELAGLDISPTSRLLEGLTSSVDSSSGPRAVAEVGASHDLAATEAEDNAAALRTCLNLPGRGALASNPPITSDNNHRRPDATVLALPRCTGKQHQEQPRVPPIHSEEANPFVNSVDSSSISSTSLPVGDASREPTSVDTEFDANTKIYSSLHSTVIEPNPTISSTSSSSIAVTSDASDGPQSVDNEAGAEAGPPQDNQCQQIDPTITAAATSPSTVPTDETRQHGTGPNTQTCITNYLHPRKRSSAHLKEAVHPSKTKKVMLAA